MHPSTLIQSVVYKPSKRKDVFYEMSSTCPKCEMEFSRRDAMLRHKRNKAKVLAVVRLSQSGSAMRQADDIEALSQVIDVKDNPTVELKL